MSGHSADRLARAALTRLAEPGDATLAEIVAERGAAGAYAAIRRGGLTEEAALRWRSRLDGYDPARELDLVARAGVRLVVPGDGEWPTQLDDLPDPVLGLWVRGVGDLRRSAVRSVALVGSRAATGYGEHVAGQLAACLAERGFTVVSGAAYGIDAAAHRGTIAVGGVTTAVLACGVDTAYPRGHERLLARIAEEGVLVSEVPVGTPPRRSRFLVRNRVIAALTRGTVVVEAALRSGAQSTARRAHALRRVVMAVPGPVTSPMSAGCHELVRAGVAQLVTDAGDVADLVGVIGADAAPERRGPERPWDALPPDLLAVLEVVPVGRPVSAARVAVAAGLDVASTVPRLAELVAAGLVEQEPAGYRLARRVRSGA